MAKIRRLEIRGFRAFGGKPQTLRLRSPMAVVWGANSQGKTSLAEAIEFLLTGNTVRRELLASAKREFAQALRNAHLPAGEEVSVTADVEDADGRLHTVRRVLVRDYTGRDPCESQLIIDDLPAFDLRALGICLSQPPLEAPVLMPHALRYVVSAEPQQRTQYFKALLEVSDLEEVRTAIANSRQMLSPRPSDVEELFNRCISRIEFKSLLVPLQSGMPSKQVVEEAISGALGVILSECEPLLEGLEERLLLVDSLLADRRAATFPVDALTVGGDPTWQRPDNSIWEALEKFVEVRSTVDRETSRLVRLFEEALRIPEIAQAAAPVDCPVCGTPKALTPERVEAIRKQLQANSEFRSARNTAERARDRLLGLVRQVQREALQSCPPFLSWDDAERQRRAFGIERINELLGDQASKLVPPWQEAQNSLELRCEEAVRRASETEDQLAPLEPEKLDGEGLSTLRNQVSGVYDLLDQFLEARDRYREASEPVIGVLREEVDRRAETEGWQDLIELARRREELLNWLIERAAYERVRQDLDQAIEQIDEAKAQVLDDKFSALSQEIRRWWDLLRPHEPTSFDGIQRGGSGRRFIDLKAQLAAGSNASSGIALRDAVAVFSDSQLNALGLAAFLARSVREGAGFVVLDDPVPASDKEHRAFFIGRVLDELVKSGIQVILLTHDERMWKDVQESYDHLTLDTFVVTLTAPCEGAMVTSESDTLNSLLARATQYIGNPNRDTRKIGALKLREAAERFCKLMLVNERKSRGDHTAQVSEYDGKNLGYLVPKVYPLLTKDPSHLGKLRVIAQRLNPGPHDDDTPSSADLQQCHGDLEYLLKEYRP